MPRLKSTLNELETGFSQLWGSEGREQPLSRSRWNVGSQLQVWLKRVNEPLSHHLCRHRRKGCSVFESLAQLGCFRSLQSMCQGLLLLFLQGRLLDRLLQALDNIDLIAPFAFWKTTHNALLSSCWYCKCAFTLPQLSSPSSHPQWSTQGSYRQPSSWSQLC